MKRTILVVLLVLFVALVGAGFYRGWVALSSPSSDAGSNKVNFNVTLDPDKVKADAQTVKEKAAELTGASTEKDNEPGNQATDNK